MHSAPKAVPRLAIDLGASSGRHILAGPCVPQDLATSPLTEIRRFDNTQCRINGHDCWNLPHLTEEVVAGILDCAARDIVPATIGIDTWGVDFVLVDAAGNPVTEAVAYRDERTREIPKLLERDLPFSELYAVTGIQKASYNTIYQLLALKRENPDIFDRAERLLMIPDYLAFVLTGVMANEYTIASTTSLLNAKTRTWDTALLTRLGLPTRLFQPLAEPGTILGPLRPEILAKMSAPMRAAFAATRVILPASHDTGSAYLAGRCDETTAFLSSGTWSILGDTLHAPILTEEARKANFSNEGGAHGTIRFLKNIMGLWMIQSVRRELNGTAYVNGKSDAATRAALNQLRDYRADVTWDFGMLSRVAREAHDFAGCVDALDARFLSPASMTAEICAACREAGQPIPTTVGELLQTIYASLATAYARELTHLATLTGKTYTALRIVGGGSQDAYLNELTAQTTGLKILTGPIEGTAIGNLMMQAEA